MKHIQYVKSKCISNSSCHPYNSNNKVKSIHKINKQSRNNEQCTRKNMSICISWSSSEHYTWLWSHTTKQKHNTHPLACHNIANTSSKHYINNLDLHTTTQNHNTQPRIASKNIANTNQSLVIYHKLVIMSVYSLYIYILLSVTYVCMYMYIYIYIYMHRSYVEPCTTLYM